MSDTTDHVEALKDKKKAHRGGEMNGCIWRYCKLKGHQYPENGRSYIKANHRRIYEFDFTRGPDRDRCIHVTRVYGGYPHHRDPTTRSNLWWFDQGSNFENSYWPWSNQLHHILPLQSIQEGLKKNPAAIELLLIAGYNVNRGVNIIILPTEERDCYIMRLPLHCGSHPDYNDHVTQIVNRVARRLLEGADPQGEHPTREELRGIKDDLEIWSAREFLVLVAWGRKFPGVKINEKEGPLFAAPPRG
ncbi:AHH domain-containing protein [Archangium sp.]|uniref:AHH domain-containing protein n=1 Tax=Archangium sp. TaxID=1872627 RepID=UPI002D31CCA5|nr:AHH domain-containing protein [Archangium sp.]HYO53820.1 AHH domain-containing protein [Archangium sp.]